MAFAAARMILKDKRRKSKEEYVPPTRTRSKVWFIYTILYCCLGVVSTRDLIPLLGETSLEIYFIFFCAGPRVGEKCFEYVKFDRWNEAKLRKRYATNAWGTLHKTICKMRMHNSGTDGAMKRCGGVWWHGERIRNFSIQIKFTNH